LAQFDDEIVGDRRVVPIDHIHGHDVTTDLGDRRGRVGESAWAILEHQSNQYAHRILLSPKVSRVGFGSFSGRLRARELLE